MIFRLLIIHDHDRTSSTTQVIRTATWRFFIASLSDRFGRSPRAVKEAIMTDMNNLVHETSTDGAVGASFLEMRRLLEILQGCFHLLRVCFHVIFVLCDGPIS